MLTVENIFRFGPFELDLGTRQLRKQGLRIKLPEKSYQLLLVLLEKPGQVVTREELRHRLWPMDVVIDFDHGLNKSIQKLRECLGDTAESSRYIETHQRVGYRFIAPLHEPVQRQPVEEAKPSLAVMAPELTVAHAAQPRRYRPLSLLAAFAIFCLLGLATWLSVRRIWPPTHPIRSLAVLPLENLSGDPNQAYFVDGMTDELITELARIPNLRVVSRTSIMQVRGDRRPLRTLARELNVEAIVEGSVVRSGTKVRINTQLIDAATDKHLWAQSFESEAGDLVALQDSVAREIAAQTRTRVAVLPQSTRVETHINPAAHEAYLRGRYFISKRQADRGAAYFKQAIAFDPDYASAYAGLADAYESETLLGMAKAEDAMPKGLAAARRAITLDPQNGEAYSALGSIETTYEWNWAAAEQDMKRGIALSPSYSFAEMRYAVLLDVMDRPDEAVDHMRRALQLDPLSFLMNRHLGSTLFFARHYDEALYHLQRAAEMEPNAPVVQDWISWIYEEKGRNDEAVSHDLAALQKRLPPAALARLQLVYHRGGINAYRRARISYLTPLSDQVCGAYELGEDYLRLGDRDQAFLWLNRAVDRRCFWLMWVKVDPLLDALRQDDRYGLLLKRLNLPQS